MVKVIAYLLVVLLLVLFGLVLPVTPYAPSWLANIGLPYQCALIGVVGGVIYCLRAVYVNGCAKKQWDAEWAPWYYIRPIVSLISGGVSWLFLKAGLLVLDATQVNASSDLGFLALAFIAGYNVDKFLTKLEQLSEAAWGIEKSRSAGDGSKDK